MPSWIALCSDSWSSLMQLVSRSTPPQRWPSGPLTSAWQKAACSLAFRTMGIPAKTTKRLILVGGSFLHESQTSNNLKCIPCHRPQLCLWHGVHRHSMLCKFTGACMTCCCSKSNIISSQCCCCQFVECIPKVVMLREHSQFSSQC